MCRNEKNLETWNSCAYDHYFCSVFSAFLLRCVKPFQSDAASDSTGTTLELCSSFIDKYGNTIEANEFAEIENEYKQLLYGANAMIAQTDLFLQNGIHNYEGYLQYMQNAIFGYEGYDYNIYAKMRELIIQETGRSSMYFEAYEDIMQQYESAGAVGVFLNIRNYRKLRRRDC